MVTRAILLLLLLAGAAQAQSDTWVNVTPGNVNLGTMSCSNFGTQTIAVDPGRLSDIYVNFNCQGIWKSTDYGLTWTGPINTGTNGTSVNGAGGITIPSAGPSNPPRIYLANIRDPGTGFWRSNDGGVSWTNYNIAPLAGNRQDTYQPQADPYDADHLLMAGHEQNALVQSTDGGQNWTSVSMASGMNQSGGTAFIFFIDTGSSTTTRTTWLYIAQGAGGAIGTWRTTNSGTSWTQVDTNEHPHGNCQIYQPNTTGTVLMAGQYGTHGGGISRSTDYGVTWAHAGPTVNEQTAVIGTPHHVYSEYGWALGPGTVPPEFQKSPDSTGTGTWSTPSTPGGLTQGAAQFVATYDGINHIILSASWLAGVWRYVESEADAPPTIAWFNAHPRSLLSGSNALLSWGVSGASSLSIDQSIGTVTGTSTTVSNVTSTTTYTLTATNAAGSTTATTTATVGKSYRLPVRSRRR